MTRTRLSTGTVEDLRDSMPRPASSRHARAAIPLLVGAFVGGLAGWSFGPDMDAKVVIGVLSAAPLRPTRGVLGRTQQSKPNDVESQRAPQPELGSPLPLRPSQHQPCGSGMMLVQGQYCPLVAHRCVDLYSDGSGRCRRYAAPGTCRSSTIQLRFCMDEFEYPNRRGEKPAVMVTFEEAQRACELAGKRLCSAREWTLACEGPDRLPYPTGLVRDRTLCNVDLAHRFPNVDALFNSNPMTSATELARLDQRTPSGAMAGCVSAFGIYDLMGNVDEWVVPDGPEEAAGFGSTTALKGGYFGPVRARCRPSTPSHGLTFRFYQVGFRCCSRAVDEEQ